MFDFNSLEALVSKVGKSTMEAASKKKDMFSMDLDLEKEDFTPVKSQTGAKKRKDRLKNKTWGETLLVDQTKGSEEQTAVAINWLLKICSALVDKVNDLSDKEEMVKTQVEKQEKQVEKKVESLEAECDAQRQKSMQGNLIVSSPSGPKATEFVRRDVTVGGVQRKEKDVEMVTRVIKEKSAVEFKESEVQACHPLGRGKDGKEPTTWIIRISNLRPKSNWDTLCAGMKTGKVTTDGTTFTNFTDTNVYLNHQITPKRSKFLQEEVKVAHKNKKIGKYMVDERGQIRVKKEKGTREDRGDQFKFYTVANKEELQKVIDSNFAYFAKVSH
jgi:hypothetical protein